MKIKIYIISIIASISINQLYGVIISKRFVQKRGEERVARMVSGYYQKGTSVTFTPTTLEQKIATKIKELGLPGKEVPKIKLSQAEIDDLKKLGISDELIKIIQEIGVDEALKRLGQKVPTDPKQAKQKLVKEVKEQGKKVEKKLGEKAPPPPPPPPSRPRFPLPTKEPKVPAKIKESYEFILEVEDLGKLTKKQRDESDYLFMKVLHDIANRMMLIGEVKSYRPKVLQKQVPKGGFTIKFDAFLFYIIDELIAQVGQNKDFYNRIELQNLVKQITDVATKQFKMTDNEVSFLKQKYKEAQGGTLVAAFQKLFESCLFDGKAHEQQLARDVETLGITLVASQRSTKKASTLQEVSSDAQIARIIGQLVEQILTVKKEDGKYQFTPKTNYIADFIKEIDRLRIHYEFFELKQIKRGLIKLLLGITDDPKALKAKDYPVLARLRAKDPHVFDPTNFRFAIPEQLFFNRDSYYEVIAIDISQEEQQRIQQIDEDEKYSVRDKLTKSQEVREEFVEKQQEGKFGLQQALAYHEIRLTAQLPEIDIHEYLEGNIEGVITIKAISGTIKQLKGRVNPKQKSIIVALEKELKELKLDIEKIIDLFKTLTNKKTISFEKTIRDVLTKEQGKKKNAIAFIEVLIAANTEYKKKKTPVSVFMFEELKRRAEKGGIDKGVFSRAKRVFIDINRTPLSVRNLFSSVIIDGQVVNKYGPKESFYSWIEPYGLLLKVIQEWSKNVESKSNDLAKNQYTLLVNSLESLDQRKMYGETRVGILLREKDLLDSGIYKKKLTQLIAAITEDRIEDVLSLITKFVKERSIKINGNGVENSKQFTALLSQFSLILLFVKSRLLAQELTDINTQKIETGITGLEIRGKKPKEITRNVQVYRAIADSFTTMLELLPKTQEGNIDKVIKQLKMLDTKKLSEAKDKIIKSIKTKLEDPKSDIAFIAKEKSDKEKEITKIVGYFKTYLDAIQTRIEQFNKVATKVKEVKAPPPSPEVNGGPPPPPPPPPSTDW